MNTTSSGPHRGTYLIVMADVLIREDLRQAIAEVTPEAEIILASDSTQALVIVNGAAPGLVAFVAIDPACFAVSALAGALAQIGARVVLTSDWDPPETARATWAILPSPFTSRDVQSVLNYAVQAP